MFKAEVYSNRRNELRKYFDGGLALFPANNESPMNYPHNTYHYRQDSNFLYFFGLDQAGLMGVIDFESGEDYLFGDDLSLDDIIWMGDQPSVSELASGVAADASDSLSALTSTLQKAIPEIKEVVAVNI